ncbi:MAG TPA: septal ring lytic transglycosylase RlpA family protein [Methylomirabilota bacterium]|nr:septal ring lytic transglycosylase RlpA family protein [Methylomirabilota bacterium]
MTRAVLAISLMATLALGACARAVVVTPPVAATVGAEETGYASWYGNPYHGRRTSSGEVYDMNDLTAAHRTLPLGTRVIVTNRDTGEAVEVRINDRGPWVEGRIIDLSYAAARILGGVGPGIIPVRLRVAALPGSSRASAIGSGFSVQVGAFIARERAEALRATVERLGEAATIAPAVVGGETFSRVRVGAYADRGQAYAAASRLAARGYRAVVVER